ncbi:DUF6412 domain-containing protein [Nocardia sp. NPDC055321]
MSTRTHSTLALVSAVVVSAWAMVFLTAGEPNSLLVLGVTALVAVTAAMLAARGPGVRVLGSAGPPVSAQRRRRGAFLRQSNPDTAGRPRPRAPGAVTA